MRRATSPGFVLLLAICALLIAGANQTVNAHNQTYPTSVAEDGLFRIKYSPVMGMNLGLVVTIDGLHAGAFTRGHIYKRHLAPGRHYIRVSPNGRDYDAWRTTLYVRPGQTYSYIAKYNVNKMLLVPVGSFH